MTKSETARQKLKALEDNTKHTIATPEALAQTKDDDINDPIFHNLKAATNPHPEDDQVDVSWKKDKNGNWYNEGGE